MLSYTGPPFNDTRAKPRQTAFQETCNVALKAIVGRQVMHLFSSMLYLKQLALDFF